jgi:hypothetical protein
MILVVGKFSSMVIENLVRGINLDYLALEVKLGIIGHNSLESVDEMR